MKFLNVRPVVFWLPLFVFTVLVTASLARPVAFLEIVTDINDAILEVFSNGFAIAAFIFVLTCIWAALSPLGKIRIGGDNAVPLLSRWNWLAITLTTTIAIGILFWATAEPIYHLYNPGGLDIEPGGEPAERFSMVSLFMHWALTPYAIYTVPGLTFALVYYNLKKPFSLSSPVSVLTGRDIPKVFADSLDGVALLSLLFGLAASLGAGIMSIAGGIAGLTGIDAGPLLRSVVATVIVGAFFISSASGLQRGIRILSDINTKIFIALMLFVLFAGPTWSILTLGAHSAVQYATEFIPRSLVIEPFNDRAWVNAWTVFYFANWLAWAPLTALFLGKIARGYTVRDYVLANCLLPALFSMMWMMIFGGTALTFERNAPGVLKSILENTGPEHVLYGVINALPLALPITVLVVIISFLSYVTAADSNTNAVASLCMNETAERQQTPKARQANIIFIKFICAGAVGLAAWVMITLSGIDGVKMLSNLGGLPALFIVLTFNAALIVLGTVKIQSLKDV